MIYSGKILWGMMGLCMSYSIHIYSMDEFGDNQRPNTMVVRSNWLSRCCPNVNPLDNSSINRVPIITPVHSSASSATIASPKYSPKQIAMITGLIIAAGGMGYFAGSTCQMCTTELQNAQQYIGELEAAFDVCTQTATYLTGAVGHLTVAVNNLTLHLNECVDTVDNLTNAIIEYCLKS